MCGAALLLRAAWLIMAPDGRLAITLADGAIYWRARP
jgi:hypothetical protein